MCSTSIHSSYRFATDSGRPAQLICDRVWNMKSRFNQVKVRPSRPLVVPASQIYHTRWQMFQQCTDFQPGLQSCYRMQNKLLITPTNLDIRVLPSIRILTFTLLKLYTLSQCPHTCVQQQISTPNKPWGKTWRFVFDGQRKQVQLASASTFLVSWSSGCILYRYHTRWLGGLL